MDDPDLFRRFLPPFPHRIAINLLSDSVVRNYFHLSHTAGLKDIFRENGDAYTNAFVLLKCPDGYQEEGRRIMLTEAHNIFAILDCDQQSALKDENLIDSYMNPPAFAPGGCLEYNSGEVQFDSQGRLRCVGFDVPEISDQREWASKYESWARNTPALMTTNEAFQLAMIKLEALSIDTAALTRDHKRIEYYQYPLGRKKIPLDTPHYQIEWKDHPTRPAAAAILVNMNLKKVVRVELNDTSYCKRPPVGIPVRTEPRPN